MIFMPTYKDEERGTWFCKFNYTDWTGKIKQKLKRGFKTQKESKAFERDFLSKSSASPDMSFESLVELYMEDSKSRVKPTSYSTKNYVIKSKILSRYLLGLKSKFFAGYLHSYSFLQAGLPLL